MPTINDYIDSINSDIEEIHSNAEYINKVDPKDLPSDFKLMMGNSAGNSKILQFIFDTRLDHVIDNLLNKIMYGNFDDLDKYSDIIKKVFNFVGIGEDTLSGPVSKILIANISNSVNSINFNSTKSKIKKCILVIRNLNKQAKVIEDKELRKKYKEAVYALKQTLRFISKVYKDRRIISNRVKRGLSIAIHEEYEFVDEELDLDFSFEPFIMDD